MIEKNEIIAKRIEERLQKYFGEEFTFRGNKQNPINTIKIGLRPRFYNIYDITQLDLTKTNQKKSYFPQIYLRGQIQIQNHSNMTQINLDFDNFQTNTSNYNPFQSLILLNRNGIINREDFKPKITTPSYLQPKIILPNEIFLN